MRRRFAVNEKKGVSFLVLKAARRIIRDFISLYEKEKPILNYNSGAYFKRVSLHYGEALFGVVENVDFIIYDLEKVDNFEEFKTVLDSSFSAISKRIKIVSFCKGDALYGNDVYLKLSHELEHAYQYSLVSGKKEIEPHSSNRKRSDAIYKRALEGMKCDDKNVKLISELIYGLSRQECNAAIQSLFSELRYYKINNSEIRYEDTEAYRTYMRLSTRYDEFLTHEQEWSKEMVLFYFERNFNFYKNYFKHQLDYLYNKLCKVYKFYSEIPLEDLADRFMDESAEKPLLNIPLNKIRL